MVVLACVALVVLVVVVGGLYLLQRLFAISLDVF